ncbi:DsrE family protein [Pleionea litopenaei]|uniref:DsrE family protein n=1 Tax=Pleionea litopenaei TaxID=3070815 RepID=A0AA51RRQ9_9GAMM|nr:DsrE family protein [Pleionea sp. HL-JVS1]WMS86385.1 DsrE family protein [Pleionea sp. HL-JVS1]
MKSHCLYLIVTLVIACGVSASDNKFNTGPLIKQYGPNATVETTFKFPETTGFKVAFDLADAGPDDDVNRRINSLARFLNMHVQAGVNPDNIELALVVHGKALHDLLNDQASKNKLSRRNPNKPLIEELMKHNVSFIVCGQSSTYYDIANDEFLPGVKVALSAMTAHALLQQQGYTLNPF